MFYPRPASDSISKTWLSEASLDSNCKTSLGRVAESLMGHPLSFLHERHPLKQTKEPQRLRYNRVVIFIITKTYATTFIDNVF